MDVSRLLLAGLVTLLTACGNATEPIKLPECDPETSPWVREPLYGGLEIAFPSNYKGDGFRCHIDTCSYSKNRADGLVKLYLPFGELTGFEPSTFRELPDLFRYKHRETTENADHKLGAFYFTLETEHEWPISLGVFVLESKDGSTFVETLWVTYDSTAHDETVKLLTSIGYRGD